MCLVNSVDERDLSLSMSFKYDSCQIAGERDKCVSNIRKFLTDACCFLQEPQPFILQP